MNKEFVPYELALELKQLGFDEPCFGYYEPNKEFKYVNWEIFKDFPYLAKNSEWGEDLVAALTYSQAFRWFREKHGLDSWIEEISHGIDNVNKRYVFQVPTPTSHLNKVIFFDTYEEAELPCLKKLIEIVKENQI